MEFIMEIERANKILRTILTEQNLGVSYSELLALASIRRGCRSLKEISGHILIDKSHVHRMLARLVEERLIEKKGIGRGVEFSITRSGLLLIEKAMKTLKYIMNMDLNREVERITLGFKEALGQCNEKLIPIYCK